jgi:hypothetical protein
MLIRLFNALPLLKPFIISCYYLSMSNEPLTWLRLYGVFCSIILLLLICLAILSLNNFSFLLNSFDRSDYRFYYDLVSSYTYISLVPGVVGIISFIQLRTPLKETSQPEKTKKIARYFLFMWIIGLVLLPVIIGSANLGHFDCNQNCVPSVFADDQAAKIFFFTWVLGPFCLWILTRSKMKRS